jgi:hypothetical protein
VSVADEWSPEIYGQDLILLSLASLALAPRQFEIVTLDVDYSGCLPAGIVLPLEFTVSSESGAALFQRKIFRRFAPSVLSFVPREGGAHLLRLAEAHHNRWWGSLQIDVLGERINQR